MAAVSIRAVHKRFGSTPVIRSVDIEIVDGEFCVLVGPSGCGKSTLLNLIGVIDQPTSGTVIIAGKRVDAMSDREATSFRLHNVGFVFQRFYLMPILSALENVELPMAEAKVPADERKSSCLLYTSDAADE